MRPDDPASKTYKGPDLPGSRGKASISPSDDQDSHSSDPHSSESDPPLIDGGDSEYSSSDVDDPGGTLPPACGAPSQLRPPPGFSIAESGFLSDTHFDICRLNPAADALVNRFILYRWAGAGWCVGQIIKRLSQKLNRHKTPKGYANFVVYYECDRTEAQHCLCFDSYNDDEVENSPVSTWVLLDQAPGPASPTPPTAGGALRG